MSIFVAGDGCIKCGLCADLCLARIICLDEANKPFVPEERGRKCVKCGQCVSFCPVGSCRLSFQDDAERGPLDVPAMPSAESAEILMRSRRSVRQYEEAPVAKETVQRIIETARYAPSAVNCQPVRWTVSMTREKTLEIAGLVASFFRERLDADPESPDARKIAGVLSMWDAGNEVIFRGAPQLATALIEKDYFDHGYREDASIALTYFELAAHANAVGCCWAGFFMVAARADEKVAAAAGAREGEVVAGAQMFGYPRELITPKVLPPRKTPDISWL